MTGPLVVVTSAGVQTSLAWWSRLRVDGQAVVLDAAADDDPSVDSLVIAEVRSHGEAEAVLRTINQRMKDGASRFDARSWPGLAPSATRQPSATAEPPGAPGRRIRRGLGLTEADARRAVNQSPRTMSMLAGKEPPSNPLGGTSLEEPDGDPPGE